MMRQCVMMVHIGRCGSTVLTEMLKAAAPIRWDGEIFEKRFAAVRQQNPAMHGVGFVLSQNPMNILRLCALDKLDMDFGFELKPFHLRHFGWRFDNFLPAVEALGFNRFVLLDRRNRLRKIVSSLIARQTGAWHVKAGLKVVVRQIRLPVDSFRLDFHCGTLSDVLRAYEREFSSVQEMMQSRALLELCYEEDIQEDPNVGLEKLARFLRYPLSKVVPPLAKTTPFTLREILTNYEEVVDHLHGTEFAWMVHE